MKKLVLLSLLLVYVCPGFAEEFEHCPIGYIKDGVVSKAFLFVRATYDDMVKNEHDESMDRVKCKYGLEIGKPTAGKEITLYSKAPATNKKEKLLGQWEIRPVEGANVAFCDAWALGDVESCPIVESSWGSASVTRKTA